MLSNMHATAIGSNKIKYLKTISQKWSSAACKRIRHSRRPRLRGSPDREYLLDCHGHPVSGGVHSTSQQATASVSQADDQTGRAGPHACAFEREFGARGSQPGPPGREPLPGEDDLSSVQACPTGEQRAACCQPRPLATRLEKRPPPVSPTWCAPNGSGQVYADSEAALGMPGVRTELIKQGRRPRT